MVLAYSRSIGKDVIKVKRMLVALVLGALLAMLIAGGVALAATAPKPGKCSVDVPTWCAGTDGDNTLIGTLNGDRLEALAGNDQVYGLGGTDALYGDAGRDVIHGDDPPVGYDPAKVGTANWDALFGGTGPDTLYADDPGACGQENCVDVLYAGKDAKSDALDGGAGADVYVVEKSDFPEGRDVITDEDQTFAVGDGVQLQEGADIRPGTLHDDAVGVRTDVHPGPGPYLYFYP